MRSRLVVVAAAVAVAALAVGSTALVWWLDGPDLAGTGDPDLAFACPAPDEPASEADSDSIPTGATRVLLCRGPGNGFQEPGDPLEARVDELVDLVNAQPSRGRPDACPDDLGIGYRLVFGYPDGTALDMTGEIYGCRHMTVGGDDKENPGLAWDFFLEALRDQRAASTPRGTDERPGCADRGSREHSPVGVTSEMVRAVMCPFFFRERDRGRGDSAPFSPEDLEVLLADQASTAHVQDLDDSMCAAELREFDIVGITAWGDHVSMYGMCNQIGDEEGWWLLGPEAQAVVDRLYDEGTLPRVTG